MSNKPITIFAFAGPSGSGKSELIQRLLDMYPSYLTKWKQATTRPKRNATDDYVFMTHPVFDAVKHTLTCRTSSNGNSYGTFPEPITGDVSVLTITDAMGLTNLREDVQFHNDAVRTIGIGKFGTRLFNLATVLMVYDFTDDEIEKRGGTRGGTRDIAYLENEVVRLKEVCGNKFDYVIDSTNSQWPNPESFFTNFIWPTAEDAVLVPNAMSLRLTILNQLELIAQSITDMENVDVLHSAVTMLEAVQDCLHTTTVDDTNTVSSVAVDDVIDTILDDTWTAASVIEDPETTYSRSLAKLDEAEDEPQYTSEYLNDRTPENTPVVLTKASETPEVEDVEVNAVEEVVEEAAVEAAVVEEVVENEPIQVAAPDEPAVPAVAPTAYQTIFADHDFTDWMCDHAIGTEAFENDNIFKTIFSQYISVHGGDPNGITVSSQRTSDKRNGRVIEYVARLPDGSLYATEFNERIKQITVYGPR